MSRYESCGNALFNETWGEYKCKLRGAVVNKDSKDCRRCKEYKKGKPQVAKGKDI